jgi:diacylglycerol kinase family enzyme
MRILVYQNLAAGHRPQRPEALIAGLQRAGHEVEWMDSGVHDVPEDAPERYDLVVAAGGDGSVGKAGRQLVGKGLPLTVYPLGTANNLAGTLGATRENLLERIQQPRLVPFDVGTIDGLGKRRRLFLEGIGLGAFARAVVEMTARGPLSAPFGQDDELARDRAGLRRAVRETEAIEVHLEIDGEHVAGRYVLCEVLNIGAVGPRVALAPEAAYGDGWLDVVLVTEEERDALDRYVEEPDAPPPGTARRAREVSIDAGTGLTLHLDGGTAKVEGPLKVGVMPGALQMAILRSG